MYLKDVEANKGSGHYGTLLHRVRETGTPFPRLWHLFAFKPETTRLLSAFTEEVLHGPSPLTPGMRELIAAFTSRGNQCAFSTNIHAGVAARLLGDEKKVQAVLDNPLTAPISEAEQALFTFLEKVNHAPAAIRQEDVDAVKAMGWSDEALYDAISVCALLNFYNRWIDATGVGDHPAEVYARCGERLATNGYAEPPSGPGKPG